MITCQYLFCFACGFLFGRICKQLKKSKFIILAALLVIIVSRETYASEVYKIEGDYRIYDMQNNPYQADMPPLNFFPNIIGYSNTNHLNLTMGNTTYNLNQTVKCNDFNDVYLGATLVSGSKYGNLGSYTQSFSYVNSESDYYSFSFSLQQAKGGQGWVDLYANIDGAWVKAESYADVGTSFNLGTVVPENKVNGWKCVCHWELTNRFTLLRPDDTYSDGYKFNQFSMIVKDSQQQAEDVQGQIEENTRQTNGLLGTIQNKIDNIITGITNLPQTILNGIHSLFVPDNIQSDFEDIMETLHDDLGVLALPIDFIHSVCSSITDTTTTVFPVHTPAFKYQNKIIFPAYDRDNILYFGNMHVFGNVGASSWFDNLMSKVGINRNMTIMQCIQAFMKLIIFIGIIRYIYNIVYEYYHMDFDDEVGGADL